MIGKSTRNSLIMDRKKDELTTREGVRIPSGVTKSNRTLSLLHARAILKKTGTMAGRKKISNQQKILRDTDQPCRMTDETGLSKIETLPRSGLKGMAKKIFELTATELIHKNLLEIVSLDLVVAYAREMALYHDTMRELEREALELILSQNIIKLQTTDNQV